VSLNTLFQEIEALENKHLLDESDRPQWDADETVACAFGDKEDLSERRRDYAASYVALRNRQV
jgi:hypothetical protein